MSAATGKPRGRFRIRITGCAGAAVRRYVIVVRCGDRGAAWVAEHLGTPGTWGSLGVGLGTGGSSRCRPAGTWLTPLARSVPRGSCGPKMEPLNPRSRPGIACPSRVTSREACGRIGAPPLAYGQNRGPFTTGPGRGAPAGLVRKP